jgi:hypothetical protein
MASNSAKKSKNEYPRKNVQVVQGKTEQETWRNLAGMAIAPEFAAHRVISASEDGSGLNNQIDVPELLSVLRERAENTSVGDHEHTEAMLINQSIALQSLFARLTEKAMAAEYMKTFETYMRLALRAQSQCRSTLETLSNIKNPPIVYAKQANIAQGHQQVNNFTETQEIEKEPNQLSEIENELCKNGRTPRITQTDDPALETLGEINRSKVRRG